MGGYSPEIRQGAGVHRLATRLAGLVDKIQLRALRQSSIISDDVLT